MVDHSTVEKGGGGFEGVKMLLCENPLPPLGEAIAAAEAALPESNYYTEAYSEPLRELLSEQLGVSVPHIHVNAGSELILRQLFDRFGKQVHLLTPTYPLFPEIADSYTETRLRPEDDFQFDLAELTIPPETTLAVVVNPNNPNGGTFDMTPLPRLLEENPETMFLVDEAFIDVVEPRPLDRRTSSGDVAGHSVVSLVPEYDNLVVTRTLSKAHSLAGFRVGYAVLPEPLANDLNTHNDAYPLARPSQAAAIATLGHTEKIRDRVATLRSWATELSTALEERGVRTFTTETYFFLADFGPRRAADIAAELARRGVSVKALDDERLGPGFMRVTTARPEENERFLEALDEIL